MHPPIFLMPWIDCMLQLNAFAFFQLGRAVGSCMEYLSKDTVTLADWRHATYEIEELLNALQNAETGYSLDESKETAAELRESFRSIQRDLEMKCSGFKEEYESQLEIDPFEAYQSRAVAMRFIGALTLELARAPIFYVKPKGVYDTRRLIGRADTVFSSWGFVLPDETIQDTKQAGRCLAFNLPTAAGFHIARATEAVIKQYMAFHNVTPDQRNWGEYIKALKGAAPQKIRTAMAQIKDLHRNPLMHVDVTLTDAEAEMLFSLCVSLMWAMVEDMKQPRPTEGLTDGGEIALLNP